MINKTQASHPSFRSILGLSALVFFMSDVRDGVGPFLSIYLKSSLGWDTQKTGMALAALSIANGVMQIPSGLIIDYTRYKRLIVILSCLIISAGCFIIASIPTLLSIVFAQSMIGVAAALISPSLAAITIGLVRRAAFAKRVSLNESWNHTGNLITALAAGITGQYLGHQWILYMVGICSLMSILSILLIDPKEIDHDAARELSEEPGQSGKPESWKQLSKIKAIPIFCASIFLFHFANAAQLPLVGQLLSQENPQIDSLFMAASIIIAQFVMIGVAYLVGLSTSRVGRKPIFLIAFLILPIRAVLYTLTTQPILLLSIQILDGMASGIIGVIGIVILSDITKGTGRFNFAQGFTAVFIELAVSLSHFTAGSIVKWWGYDAGFFSLAGIAVVGFLFFWMCMPETKERKTGY